MKIRVAIAMTVLLAFSTLPALAQKKAPDKDKATSKPQILESGVITKIDLKKMMITVHGVSFSFPEVAPGQSSGAPGGRGGRGNRDGGDGGDSNENTPRDMKIYVSADTFIEKDKTMLKLEDLKEAAEVTVIGTSKGKSGDIDAFSISVTEKQ